MDTKTMLNQIKALLNAKVNLASATLDNGAVLEADSFEAGSNVFIVTDGEKVPLPIGEYTTDDGKKLVVEEEGVIASFNLEDKEEEEMEEAEEKMEDKKEELEDEIVEVEAPAEIAPEIAEVVEAVVEVIAPVIEEVKAQVEEMKEYYEEEKKKDEEEMEEEKEKTEMSKAPARKPLKHSPETKDVPKMKKLNNSQETTTMDRVFARISKIG